MVEQYQALVERVLGVHFTEDERPPRLVTPKINLQKAKEVIRSIKEVEEVKHVILAHLEAKVETREWGMENLIQLIEQLPNMAIVATASPHYWATHRRSLPTSPRIRRVDTGSILDAIGLLDSVDLLLSPDTSMVHFAAALRKPIVAFYPYKDEWLPYRANSIVLYPVRSEPISTIGVAEVRDAIFALLSD
jgi:ADP-heptose:LPS heptosyltransferase